GNQTLRFYMQNADIGLKRSWVALIHPDLNITKEESTHYTGEPAPAIDATALYDAATKESAASFQDMRTRIKVFALRKCMEASSTVLSPQRLHADGLMKMVARRRFADQLRRGRSHLTHDPTCAATKKTVKEEPMGEYQPDASRRIFSDTNGECTTDASSSVCRAAADVGKEIKASVSWPITNQLNKSKYDMEIMQIKMGAACHQKAKKDCDNENDEMVKATKYNNKKDDKSEQHNGDSMPDSLAAISE
ncbi:unnamed protein product, partial [Prorocentrum cordatum]